MTKKLTSLTVQNTVRILGQDPTFNNLVRELSDKEKVWADLYLQTLNKKRTSELCGQKPENAAGHGIIYYNRPHVNEYINYVIRQHIGVPDDSIKLLRTIQDTDIKQYMTGRQAVKRDYYEKPLKHMLRDLEDDLTAEEDHETFNAGTRIEISRSKKRQKELAGEILKMKAAIKKEGPLAKRVLIGPEYLVTVQVLDINKICADVEYGKIKKYKETKDGNIEIELYDAKDAAVELLKLSGAYAKDHNLDINVNFDQADVKFE